MTASDYPITTPYGQVPGYPLNNGFHNGIDYGCPSGTPVVVNGVTIGLSGESGYVTGPHLHVGRWVNGEVTDPGGGKGFHFTSAEVTQVSSDAVNGKYVRVQADGASWVYLHLSEQTVTTGQVLKGDDEMVDDAGARLILEALTILTQDGSAPDRQPTTQEVTNLVGRTWPDAISQVLTYQGYKNNLAKVKYYDADVAKTVDKASVLAYVGSHLT